MVVDVCRYVKMPAMNRRRLSRIGQRYFPEKRFVKVKSKNMCWTEIDVVVGGIIRGCCGQATLDVVIPRRRRNVGGWVVEE